MNITDLQPKALWEHFANLNAVPRASKKEEQVIAFIKNFGEELGLPTVVDKTGNIIIKKPATKGFENKPTVLLQSHIDMVHQKNAATNFDFATEGIKMYVDEDWVKADGTTLGADNGIGVAAIMTILAANDLQHPALEALFTIDEETGMTGAFGLEPGVLSATIMLNLDTEEDDELTIGCAGGIDVTGTGSYKAISTPENYEAFTVVVNGLTGGHSGMDIHRGRGNACKILNAVLAQMTKDMGIVTSSIDSGGLRNAIPREGKAVVVVPKGTVEKFTERVKLHEDQYQSLFADTDPGLCITATSCELPSTVLEKSFQTHLLSAIYGVHSGIYRMSPTVEGLVQTSNNLARVLVLDGEFKILCLTRSSVEMEKMELADGIAAVLELAGATVACTGSYPGWAPKPNTGLANTMANLYKKLFNEEAHVNACHAGLECGIVGANYPDMEMISFGPTIRGAHSPDERVQISSVQKFWKYLVAALEQVG